MDFDAFIAPLPPDVFLAEHYRRAPLHLPAPQGSGRADILDWDGLNALLAVERHWTRENIRLVRGGKPVAHELYMADGQGKRSEQANPGKVAALLATGASLVAQSLQEISPALRGIALMLAQRLCGRVTVTAISSFDGVAGFPPHFDPHEVFAVHTKGEKVWRIYDAPADNPLQDSRYHEAGAEPAGEASLLREVVMRPGDLLYIPRGYRHEALASARESLHVSFSVEPAGGSAFFRLLKDVALHDPAFRAYLPDARDAQALAAHLDALAGRLAAIVRSPAFADEVATAQQKLAPRPCRPSLPHRPALDHYVRTKRPATVRRTARGALLALPDGEEVPLGQLREEAEWILAHPMFSLQDLAASFPHRTDEALAALIAAMEAADVLRRVRPAH